MDGAAVLVTAIGSFAADAVIGNLKSAGFRLVGCDIYPREWLATSSDVDAFYQAPLARDTGAYLEFLASVIAREEVRYLIPLTDVEVDVLNANRSAVAEAGAVLCLSPKATIDICRSKKATADFIERRGLTVQTIPTIMLSDAPVPERFPVVCKPSDGRSSEGLTYVRTRGEWDLFAAENRGSNYVVQPFVEGRVVAVDVVRDPADGRTAVIPREELLRTPNGAGTSVFVFRDGALAVDCARLAEALGIVGCVIFEFLRDGEGAYHLLECNPRFSGGVRFSCMAGYDCVLNHLRCFMGKPIDGLKPYEERYIARKYGEYTTKLGR